MKREIEISAKTKEEAIEKAVAELGAPNAAALVITVVREARKGFLGFGTVDAVIHAVYQVPDAPVAPAEPAEGATDGQDGDRPARAPRQDRNRRRGDRRSRPATGAEEPASEAELGGAEEPVVQARPEPIDPSTATPAEQTAYRFICKLVEDMGIPHVTVTMYPGNSDNMVISIDGEEAGILIGHHGDTLDSLQYLANLAANHKEEGEKRAYARITVDAADYRAKREAALRALARRKGALVLKYKKSIMLEPMNPYERRIIHSEIQKLEGVSTNSIGADSNRRVVIFLEAEGMPTAGIRPAHTGSESSGRSSGRNRRRKPKSERMVDPLAPATNRQPQPSLFDENDQHDPFDIDLSVALPQEDDEE